MVCLLLVSRFGISVITGSTMQISAELMPTCVRSSGLAVVHVTGAAFSYLSSNGLHSADETLLYLYHYKKLNIYVFYLFKIWLCRNVVLNLLSLFQK